MRSFALADRDGILRPWPILRPDSAPAAWRFRSGLVLTDSIRGVRGAIRRLVPRGWQAMRLGSRPWIRDGQRLQLWWSANVE